MRMNNKGQLAGWEAMIIVILLVALGFVLYLLISKETQSNVFQSGSKPVVNGPRTDWPFSVHIGEGGCARMNKTDVK